jgi:hypothetical protein
MSTLMKDRLGVLPHVVEAILNHISGTKGGVVGVYNKALYLRERVARLTHGPIISTRSFPPIATL